MAYNSVLIGNNAYGTLAGSIDTSVTTVSLTAGHGARFPAASSGSGTYFYATLIDSSNNLEIIKVTNRSTDTLTVERGVDGTSGTAYSAGDRIELRPTAALFEHIRDSERTPIDASVTLAKLAAAVAASLMPAGALAPYAGAAAPTGWLLCYGQAISRTTYADLFTAISTTYGVGDGVTTFNLPDLRGRVVAGQDDMGGTSANRLTNQTDGVEGDTLGATGGAETNTLTIAEMPLHGHAARISNNAGSAVDGVGGMALEQNGDSNYAAFTGTPSETAGEQIGGTGGGTAHNNVQPTIILNYIIKT